MSTDVMTDASSRKLSCKRQEARAEAVLGARRPVQRPSWAPGGPSGGRLERQEARREAVLDARRLVGRLSGARVRFYRFCCKDVDFAQATGRS